METTLLRTMTYKSSIDFGTLNGLTVKQALDFKKTYQLRWIYYNCSKLSFIEEILDQIYIPKEYRIKKPGKDIQMFDAVNKLNNSKCQLFGWNKFKRNMQLKKKKRIKRNILEVDINKNEPSKAMLQARNHGHCSSLNKKNVVSTYVLINIGLFF